MTPVRLELAALRSRVKHSTTEPLRSLGKKCDRAPGIYIKQKCFVGVRYQNVTKLCPLFARCIGSKRFMWMCQSPPFLFLHIPRFSLANISLQYKLLRTKNNGYPTRFFLFLKENVCSGYSLEAALSNVNDSFTLSRLLKRPKHFVIRHVMSTHNLHFFFKYTESGSTIFMPIRRRTPTLFKCCSLIYDRITC